MNPTTSHAMKLVVHADDLGLNSVVNRGILRGHREGIVSSTSFLANFPTSPEGAEMARATPTLEVGLHLNFTEGVPLTAGRSLVGADGQFRRRTAQMIALIFGRLNEAEVVAEGEAQFARARALGLSLTHVDGHEHIHLFGVVRKFAAALARREGLVLRRPQEPGLRGLDGNGTYFVRRSILNLLSSGSTWSGLPHATTMVDLTGPCRGRSADWVLARLAGESGVVEMMCHPGEAGGPAHDPLRVRRAEELAILTTPGMRERLTAAGIELTTLRASLLSDRRTSA